MIIWIVIWIVLMMFWLFFGFWTRDPGNKYGIAGTLIPFLCVLILGLILFGVIGNNNTTVLTR